MVCVPSTRMEDLALQAVKDEMADRGKERIGVFAAPDTKARIEESKKYRWAFVNNLEEMMTLVEERVRVAVVDLTEGKGFEIKECLQALGDECPGLILITRPSTEPTVYGPWPPSEPGSPTWMVYPVNVGNLEAYIQRILESLDEEQKSGEDDVVARVQSQIDAAAKHAEEFEKRTHLRPGDEHKRVVT